MFKVRYTFSKQNHWIVFCGVTLLSNVSNFLPRLSDAALPLSLPFFLVLEPDTPVVRDVNASCCRPDLDVKCAVCCGLTVNVPIIPLALHAPIGQDLEVMSAIHAVQPSQPPVVRQQAAVHGLILGYEHLLIRHPARMRRSGVADREAGCLGRLCPLQRSGVCRLVNERSWMRAPEACVIPGAWRPQHLLYNYTYFIRDW